MKVDIDMVETWHHYWDFHAEPNPRCRFCVCGIMEREQWFAVPIKVEVK